MQRREVIFKKIESLDTKLQNLQQHAEDLEKEWEKGEKEWREHLKECKKIEEDGEDFLQSQETQQNNVFTFGLSHLELLQRYPQLERRVQKHIARSKELRGFYEKVSQHRHGLRIAATKLKAWEEALAENEVVLQKHIDQMDELGEKFSGEAKDCREHLEKSRERLQTCREKNE